MTTFQKIQGLGWTPGPRGDLLPPACQPAGQNAPLGYIEELRAVLEDKIVDEALSAATENGYDILLVYEASTLETKPGVRVYYDKDEGGELAAFVHIYV